MFRSVLILSSLLVIGYGISCYECEVGVFQQADQPADQPDCTEENKMECGPMIDSCVSLNFERKRGDRVEVQEYQKTCGNPVLKSCEAFKAMLKNVEVWSKCNIVTCTGDLCNTLTAEEVKMLGTEEKSNEGDDKNDENEESYVSSGRNVAANIVLMTVAAYFYF